MTVGLYNPLPGALAHYSDVLSSTLTRIGVHHAQLPAVPVEMGVTPKSRMRVTAASFAEKLVQRPPVDDVLVLWPGFGLLEPAAWVLSARRTIWIIVHDVSPLQRSLGTGRLPRMLGRAAAKGRNIKILVHGQLAERELSSMGWRAQVVPHPCALQVPKPPPLGIPKVLVAGQYKPTRATRLLIQIGPELRELGFDLEIVGRGWPTVPGWRVTPRFVSEAELYAALISATVVLVPYERVYQSGIAARAAELGRPVVGPSASNIGEIFGSDWPGCVPGLASPSAWVEAIVVAAAQEGGVSGRLQNWQNGVDSGWRRLGL